MGFDMREKICSLSLFSFILAIVTAMPAGAAVKMKNSNRTNYAGAYNQVAAISQQQTYNQQQVVTSDNLPVAVDDSNLADAIANNTSSTTVDDLEKCSMTIIGGNFKWGVPESGRLRNSEPRCLVVVDLREADSQEILATTTLAVGDTMDCNIDSFPRSGWRTSVFREREIELPADNAPTMEDVIAVMNQEQKQNAGVKIAAGALIAGVAGNLLGPKAADDKKTLGVGKSRLISTAVGATAGAGIMAASTFSGKVAGDTIKSTAVNAASGMVVGNMMAGASSGDSVVAITKCSVGEGAAASERDCVFGKIETIGDDVYKSIQNINENECFYIINKARSVRQCSQKCNCDESKTCKNSCGERCEKASETLVCKPDSISLLQIELAGASGKSDRSFDNVFKKDGTVNNSSYEDLARYVPDKDTKDVQNAFKQADYDDTTNDTMFFKVKAAKKGTGKKSAYAVFESGTAPKKMFGYKISEWDELAKSGVTYWNRNSDGSVGDKIEFESSKQVFTPLSRDADDGELVDLNNQARLKATLVGAGTGGALGGLSGYEGAKSEVQERYAEELRNYEESLSKFMCSTGNKYIVRYNDPVLIKENPTQE